jgi:hypothetical protein
MPKAMKPAVSARARLCFEYAPSLLEALEKVAGCYDALWAQCNAAAPDDEERLYELLGECGATDLAEVLMAFAGRICAATGDHDPAPLDTDEAREKVAVIAARYAGR